MKPKRFPIYFSAIALLGIVGMAESKDLVVDIQTTKEAFFGDEAVVLDLTLSNSSTRELKFLFDYPNHLGVSFSCSDSEVASSPFAPLAVSDRRIPILNLLPGQAYRVSFVLNRFLLLQKPKEYRVKYSAEYMEPVSKENPRPAVYLADGEIVVQIIGGKLQEAEVQEAGAALETVDRQRKLEIVERLLWIDDPKAIQYLVKAAETVPEASRDIVVALEKFVQTPQGLDALRKVGEEGDANTLKTYLDVAARKNVDITDAEYKRMLSSPDVGKRYFVVQHLVCRERENRAELVKPMANDPSPEIRDLAHRYLSKSPGAKP